MPRAVKGPPRTVNGMLGPSWAKTFLKKGAGKMYEKMNKYLIFSYDEDKGDWSVDVMILFPQTVHNVLKSLEDVGYLHPYEISLGVA